MRNRIVISIICTEPCLRYWEIQLMEKNFTSAIGEKLNWENFLTFCLLDAYAIPSNTDYLNRSYFVRLACLICQPQHVLCFLKFASLWYLQSHKPKHFLSDDSEHILSDVLKCWRILSIKTNICVNKYILLLLIQTLFCNPGKDTHLVQIITERYRKRFAFHMVAWFKITGDMGNCIIGLWQIFRRCCVHVINKTAIVLLICWKNYRFTYWPNFFGTGSVGEHDSFKILKSY